MAVIIDASCIPLVFSKKNSGHEEFAPVLKWIMSQNGVMVYGGSTYEKELSKLSKYLKIIRFLREIDKVIVGNKKKIDQLENEVEKKVSDKDFDDPHLVGIVIDTKCRVICSEDARSVKFVKRADLYPKRVCVPVYYTGSGNSDLLTEKYIDDSLKPLCKINKSTRKAVSKLLSNL
ncbi:MAG: hypothetical protein WD512_14455 [Candidatus Paceibacterota bacterium]